MAKTGSNFWLGLIIGLLAALLCAAILVLVFPRLRPIIGETKTNTPKNMVALPTVNQVANQSNTTQNNATSDTMNTTATHPVEPQTAENIRVTQPLDLSTIANPVVVAGEARTFEQAVNLRVRDGDGRVLAEVFTMSHAPDLGIFGPYSISVSYSEPAFDYGSIEVYESSAKDGSEVNKVVVPVYFEK